MPVPNDDVLSPFQDKYYQLLNGDCTTRMGFQQATKLGVWTEAPDWNPDPGIDCGGGLHVVKGHPLFAWAFVSRNEPLYAEVATDPFPPVKSLLSEKYRAKRIVKLRWVTKSDPEFAPAIMHHVVTKHENSEVCARALEALNFSVQIELLQQVVRGKQARSLIDAFSELSDKFWKRVPKLLNTRDLKWLLDEAFENKNVCIAVIEGLDKNRHQTILRALADCGGPIFPCFAALKKLDPAKNMRIFIRWIERGGSEEELYAIRHIDLRGHPRVAKKLACDMEKHFVIHRELLRRKINAALTHVA